MPKVVMNDGTHSRVVTSPLTSPTSRPNTTISAMTGQVRLSSPSIRAAAITTWAPTRLPTERSNSPETMTKYWPIARITNGAALRRNAISDGGWKNDGLRKSITTSSATSTTNTRSEEHTSELQSRGHLVCRLLLEKKKMNKSIDYLVPSLYYIILLSQINDQSPVVEHNRSDNKLETADKISINNQLLSK